MLTLIMCLFLDFIHYNTKKKKNKKTKQKYKGVNKNY